MKNPLQIFKRMWGIRSLACMSMAYLLGASVSYAQHTVSGKVTDIRGEALTGVNVVVKGSATGTVTNVEGNYQVEVSPDAVLIFSFVGYTSEEVAVNGRAVIDIALAEDIQTLQELVVVGYGVVRKSDLTGSVSQVSAEEITKIASQDINQSLQGRVPGMQVISNSGNPAEGARVRIRGMGTINNSSPLYVVDGFQTDDISWLTSNDIQSIEALKDASATAIYGSRGANGVILITTKDGSRSPKGVNVEVNAYAGLQKASSTLDLMNAHQYIRYRVEGWKNQLRHEDQLNNITRPDGYYTDQLALQQFAGADTAIARQVLENRLVGTDWQEAVLRQAVIQNYNLAISGRSERHNYMLSGSFQDNEGIVENSYVQKLTLRFKNDLELSEWATIGLNLGYVGDELTQYEIDRFNSILPVAVRADPLAPVWNENTDNWGDPSLSDARRNPAQIVDELGKNLWNRNKFIAGAYLQFDITDNLNFRSEGYYNLDQRHLKEYLPEYFVNNNASRSLSQLNEGFETRTNWMSSNYFNYNRDLGDHRIGMMLGAEWQSNAEEINTITAFGVPEAERLRYLNQSRETDSYQASTTVKRWALQSYFGRLNYGFANRYNFTATLRYDGSSRFIEANRWGLFPSFAAAWNLAQESFMSDINLFSALRLRASWGQVGNEASADPHGTVTYADPLQNYSFGGQVVNGKAPRQLSNPNLIWETSETLNFGVDMGLFNDQLTVMADYFIKETKDMIVAAPSPLYSGAKAPLENTGSIRNNGFEFAINYLNNQHAVKFNFGYNMSFINNEVTSLGRGTEFIEGDNFSHIGIITRTQVGHPVSAFYGIRTNGIFKSEAELEEYYWQPNAALGDIRFVNQNGDSTITLADDAVFLGNPFPDFTAAFSAGVEFAGFDLSLLINATIGNEVVNNLSRYMNISGDWRDNLYASRLDYYSETNTDTDEPRVIANDPNGNDNLFSDRFVEDGSFIRLRNLQLGYTLPKTLTESLGIRSLRIYVSADNLLTLTDYKGFDPEIGEYFNNPLNFGVGGANYPKPRIFFGGINLKF